MPVIDRVRNAWNAFRNISPQTQAPSFGTTSYFGGASPARTPLRIHNERSFISSIYTKLGVDVASFYIKHVKLDSNKRYLEDVNSALNHCLTIQPNVDQGPRAIRQDIAMTLFDKGVAAVVPVDTSVEPDETDFYDIYSLRVGEITAWFPEHVRVSLFNEKKQLREEILLPKSSVAVVENPLYSVMNEPNSTLQRLIRKLTLLDSVDEASSSGKLDIIIQLPYVVKSETRRQQAENRREDIEFQLRGSQYGIAYIDGTEKITQLNRPAENNLLKQIEYLTNLLYSQLGLTEKVMSGSADEAEMINYFARTIEPIVEAIVEAMQRSWLAKAGPARNEQIRAFKTPFRFVTTKDLAEIGDKFTRNEILTSNEIRDALGFAPSSDPKADELRNSNMPQPEPTSVS